MIDAAGRTAAFTGKECQDWAGHKTGKNYTVQGNILAGKKVVDDMADTFEETAGLPLAERLIAVLRAGQAAGGDTRGRQSAALLVVVPVAVTAARMTKPSIFASMTIRTRSKSCIGFIMCISKRSDWCPICNPRRLLKIKRIQPQRTHA